MRISRRSRLRLTVTSTSAIIAIVFGIGTTAPSMAVASEQLRTTAAIGAQVNPLPHQKGPQSAEFRPVTSSQSIHGPSAEPALPVINCSLSAPNPHQSGHVPGTVNFNPVTSCTSAVASIAMGSALGDSLGRVSTDGGICSNLGKSSLNCPTSMSCKTAKYWGSVDATVTAPPGYTPSTLYLSNESNTVSITC